METKKFVSLPVVNLNVINDTFKKIDEFVKANNYQYKDRHNLDIVQSYFVTVYNDLSKKKRKKLAQYVWRINNHPTIEVVNKFFHFLMKFMLKSDLRVRVLPSAKEIAIQEKRKAYKAALTVVQKAYADYKTEKGDFYKDRAVVLNYLSKKSAA